MVQHSSTPHHHECWLLDVKRLSTPHLLQCLVTSPSLLEANLILVVNKAFVFLEFAASSLVQGLWCRTMNLFLTEIAAYEGLRATRPQVLYRQRHLPKDLCDLWYLSAQLFFGRPVSREAYVDVHSNVTRHPDYLAQFLRVQNSGSRSVRDRVDFATSLCEDSCTGLVDKSCTFVMLAQNVFPLCRPIRGVLYCWCEWARSQAGATV